MTLSSPLIFSAIPIIPEWQYTLRLAVVPCRYFSSPLPSLQLIFPSPSSHILSVAIPHLLRFSIHICCPASPPLCSSTYVFTADLVWYPYLTRLCCSPYTIIFHSYVYFAAVVCLPSPVGSSPHSASFCTALLALLWSTLILSLPDLIFSLNSSFLFWHGYSLSPWCSCSAMICHVFPPLAVTTICSNLIIPLSSVCSDMISTSLIWSTMIAPLILWSACSDPLGSARSYMIYHFFLWTF